MFQKLFCFHFPPILLKTILLPLPPNTFLKFDHSSQEDICDRVFRKHRLRLDVEISTGVVGHDLRYPYIKVESLIQSLDRHGKLDKFLGFGPTLNRLEMCGDLLEGFWGKLRPLHPNHEVYALAEQGKLSLRQAVPVYLHGDEGTTYKKDGCLVLSIHTPLGAGSHVSHRMGAVREDRAAATNYIGNALETRFMLAAMLRVS